ncbi:MAG TPA: ion channel [Vicinamibacteria bacterium]|jgi:inward rectifier potassium channel|nr:ion channel [Vicinamibacteria bacterium]
MTTNVPANAALEAAPLSDAPATEPGDLGLGSRLSQAAQIPRLLNRDGSFNVTRFGLPFYRSLNPYHALVTISWTRFYTLLLALYLVTNLLFAGAYIACGPQALQGVEIKSRLDHFMNAFFFSVQTLATIGYGRISPEGFAANALVSVEALIGLLGFALATGLAFARFSQPSAKILFSHKAVIAPYRGMTAFMFRIANERENQLLDLKAQVVFSRRENEDGQWIRKFHALPLERSSVMFFPTQWVIVHPINASSPLRSVGARGFLESDAEFLILLTGYDETSAQTVHARSSYKGDEVVVGARFGDMFVRGSDGVCVDLARIHDIETVSLPDLPSADTLSKGEAAEGKDPLSPVDPRLP